MKKKGFTLVEVLAVIIILNILLIIGVIGTFSIIKKEKENSYKTLITSVLNSTKLYISDNNNIEEELDLNGYYIITLNDLVSNKIIKGKLIDPRTDEQIALTKKIVITKKNDLSLNICYEDVDCYVPELLVNKLEQGIVINGEGLYQELDNNNNQVSYYKGSNPNNYLIINDNYYRIVKINLDKSIKLVFEGKKQGTVLINNGKIGFQPFNSTINNNFNDSDLKLYLQTWFDNNISDENKKFITINEENFSNSAVAYQFNQTKSALKNAEIFNINNIKVGLLSGYEYLNASLDLNCTNISNCSNQNYLTKNYDYFLMIKDNSTLIWKFNLDKLEVVSVLNESNIRPVINLKNNVLVGGGNGTFLDPYVIKNLGIKDQEKPTLNLIGDSEIDLIQNTSYVELGATATDNIDGDISDKIIIIENINISVLGTYFVEYSVSDSSGNKKIVTRKINVIE